MGSIVWNHVDFSGQTITYSNMPMLETTEHWELYSDSFGFTDTHVIDLNKPLTESVTPSESRDTMTFVNQMWAGWGEVYSGEDYFLDDDGTYLIPTEFTVDGITYPSEVVVALDAPAVTTNKYTDDTLDSPTDSGELWVNQYVDLLYFADDDGDYGVGKTQTF